LSADEEGSLFRMSVLQTKFEFNLRILSVPFTINIRFGVGTMQKISKTVLSFLAGYQKGED
jgi:hypothetical protein